MDRYVIAPRSINLSDSTWLPGEKELARGLIAAASSDNAVVTYTMLKTLAQGGNAVDAGIAGCMVQAALEPFMTNHTGTITFLFYHAAEEKFYQLDSTGTFPSGLPLHMPLPQGMGGYAAIPPRSVIPGFMPGVKALYERFGTLPWASLCEEAVWWAENGHTVSAFEAEMNQYSGASVTFFPEGRKFFMPGGRFPYPGERFASKEMAQTLRRVAKEGPDYMITGEWADHFISKANEMGWAIEKRHMTETPPRWIEPLRFRLRDWEIVSLAPPQQQGVFLSLVLGMLDKLQIDKTVPYSAMHLFYMGHALKLAQQICGYTNDPQVLNIRTDLFLDETFHASLADMIRGMVPKVDLSTHIRLTTGFTGTDGKVPSLYQDSASMQPSGSCELSIVDAEGNWVQMMDTLQGGGIPGQVVDGIPMVGCHALPNIQNTPISCYLAEGARVRTVMGNTMVLKNGRPILQLGTPGNVHVTVAQVLCNYLFFGMSPEEAVAAPRMLALMENATLVVEDRIPEAVQNELLSLGVRMKVSYAWDYHMGSFQICYRDENTGELCALADPRRCGTADGLR